MSEYKYRKNEFPTGKEVKDIVGFYAHLTRENTRNCSDKLARQINGFEKRTTILTAVNAAVVFAILLVFHKINR